MVKFKFVVLLVVFFMSQKLFSLSHTFSFKDFVALKRVGGFVATSDGKKIIFEASTYIKEKNTFVPHLYLYEKGEGVVRQITFSNSGEYSPVLSPDEKYCAFLSSRDGVSEIWVMPLDLPGEAYKLFASPLDLSDLKWKGDNSKIFFSALVFPECKDDLKCTRFKLDEKKKSRVSALVYENIPIRHWNKFRDGRVKHIFMYNLKTLEIKDLTPGNFDALPFPYSSSDDYDVSPDGKFLCYAAKKKNVAWSTNFDLYEVSLDSFKTTKLTSNKGYDGVPVYSNNGRFIAFKSQNTDGFESDKFNLKIFDRKSGKITNLTDDFPDWVVSYRWDRGDRYIFFNTYQKGYMPLYRIPVHSKKIRFKKLTNGLTVKEFQTISDSKTLIVKVESLKMPSELFFYDIKSKKLSPISNMNKALLNKIKFGEYSEIEYESEDGSYKIHGFMLKPPVFKKGKKYPLIVLIHGGPQGAWMNSFHPRWNLELFASMGYVVIAPNPTGSVGYGQKFINAISKDWGGRCYKDIMKIFDFAKKFDFIDTNRVCAAGGSFGGYMVNLIATRTDRFKCLVTHAGVYNLESMYGATEELWFPEWEFGGTPWDNPELYEKFSPHKNVTKVKTPVLIIHGQHDYRVPVEQAFSFFNHLKRLGKVAKLVYFPDECHFIQKVSNLRFWYETVKDWFDKYLSN